MVAGTLQGRFHVRAFGGVARAFQGRAHEMTAGALHDRPHGKGDVTAIAVFQNHLHGKEGKERRIASGALQDPPCGKVCPAAGLRHHGADSQNRGAAADPGHPKRAYL
jgi:hypothetical protein